MTLTAQIAKHLRDVYHGGNWTTSNLQDNVKDLSWEEATTQVESYNTIVALVYHINYYVSAIGKALAGGPLDSKDAYSFDHPPVSSEADWQRLLERVWADVETCVRLIAELPDSKLSEDFIDPKYGSYFRNLHGLIEHSHYHLGQIALIRKSLLQAREGA